MVSQNILFVELRYPSLCLIIFYCHYLISVFLFQATCPEGYFRLPVGSKSCFSVHNTQRTWTEAVSGCARDGGTLASLKTREEADFVVNLLTSSEVYYINFSYLLHYPTQKRHIDFAFTATLQSKCELFKYSKRPFYKLETSND